METQPQDALSLSFTVVLNIIGWMIMITAIGFGTIQLNGCPAQPYIPIYLIVLGVCSLLTLSLTYIQSPRSEGAVGVLISASITILHIVNFCWFVAGTVWVYGIYPPNYSAGEDGYCQKTIYHLAFFFTSLCWLLIIALFFYGGFLLVLAGCNFAVRGHSLSRLNVISYDGTKQWAGGL